jgi:type I restriction enzyme S subunit
MKWETVSLGSIIDLSKGKKHEFNPKGNNRYLTIEDLHNPDNSAFTNENGTLVMESDLIIAWDGANAGKVGVGYNGVIGSTLARMRIKVMNFDSRFLFWFLVSKNELIKSQRTGATIPHVNGAALKEIQIPLPPLPIQKRIADILDAADALRKKDEALLKKYDELAQAIFIDMFGDPVKNEKGWEVKKINNCIIQKPDNGFFAKNEHYFEGGTPIVWISNFIDKTYISQSSLKRVKTNPSDSKYYLKYGDALFCRSSLTLEGIGKCSIAPMNLIEPTIFECHIIRLQFDLKKIVPEYFRFLSDTKYFRNKIMKSAKTSTMTTISQEGITDIEIPIPALNIQLQFRDKVKIFEKLKTQSVKTHNDTEELFSTILNKAFTGELVS